MRSTFFLTALFTLFAGAFALDNAFTFPIENGTYEVGSTINLQWANASGSTVDLLLKTGDSSNLQTYATIGSNVPNQGSVAWTIPNNIPTGNYAFELINNDNADDINYSTFIYIHNPQAVSSSVTATTESVGDLTTAAANSTTAAVPVTTSAPVSSSAPVVPTTTSANSTSAAVSTSATAPSTSSSVAVAAPGGVNGTNSRNTTTSGAAGAGAAGAGKTNTKSKSGKSSKTGSASASGSAIANSTSTASKASKANAALVNTWSVGGVVGAIGAVALML